MRNTWAAGQTERVQGGRKERRGRLPGRVRHGVGGCGVALAGRMGCSFVRAPESVGMWREEDGGKALDWRQESLGPSPSSDLPYCVTGKPLSISSP